MGKHLGESEKHLGPSERAFRRPRHPEKPGGVGSKETLMLKRKKNIKRKTLCFSHEGNFVLVSQEFNSRQRGGFAKHFKGSLVTPPNPIKWPLIREYQKIRKILTHKGVRWAWGIMMGAGGGKFKRVLAFLYRLSYQFLGASKL